MTFKESGIEFHFNKKYWSVKKFDEHPFYQAIAGAGMKGVDFIGVYQQEYVVLMEVKNYVDRFEKDKIDPSKVFLTEINLRIPTFIQKFEDGLQAIRVIYKHYQRKRWFRWLEQYVYPYIPHQWLLYWEWGFWLFVFDQTQKYPPQVKLILWLESDGRQDWRQSLTNVVGNALKESGDFVLEGLRDDYLEIRVRRIE